MLEGFDFGAIFTAAGMAKLGQIIVGDLAVEHDFAVTGALELFEDDLVHLRAGVDQRGGDDRERAAFLDIAGGAEEALRTL